MGIYKRNGIPWISFSIDGKQYRMPVSRLKTSITLPVHTRPLAPAIDAYLSSRGLAPATLLRETQRSAALKSYFKGGVPNADEIQGYIDYRRSSANDYTIERELKLLRRVARSVAIELPRVHLSHKYRVSPVLTADQKAKFLSTAASKPCWKWAHFLAVMMFSTTMRQHDIRQLTWADIDFDKKIAIVRNPKNKIPKVIPLNNDALTCLTRLTRGRLNDTIFPIKSVKTSWKSICKLTNMPAGFTRHSCRHQAATELLENPAVSESTVDALCGWISPNTKRIYSHHRIEALRHAVTFLSHGFEPERSDGGERGWIRTSDPRLKRAEGGNHGVTSVMGSSRYKTSLDDANDIPADDDVSCRFE